MSWRRLSSIFLATFLTFWLTGCAGHRVIGSGKATVTLNRGDLKELREAFRTTSEKTVSLPSHGEIACEEYRCRLAIRGQAPIYENEALVGHKQVSGTLAFAPAAPPFLIGKLDEASERDKDFSQVSETGHVSCNGRRCVLEFTFPKDGTVLLDAAGDQLLWK